MIDFPAPGIYTMPADEYHQIAAASNSGLKHIARSPLHFQAALNTPTEPTPAMLLGSAVHTAILEPSLFDLQYVVPPEDRPKRPTAVQRNAKKPSSETLAAIDWWDAFNVEHAGKTILTADDMESVRAMTAAVLTNPDASDILSAGVPEQSIFWIDADTGAQCKARIDWLRGPYPADLKTTDDASPEAFARSCAKYSYATQAAFYLDGLATIGERVEEFPFIVVEKSAPYAVAVYRLNQESVEFGRRTYKRHLATYAWCMATGSWHGYPSGIQEISLPRWAMGGDEE